MSVVNGVTTSPRRRPRSRGTARARRGRRARRCGRPGCGEREAESMSSCMEPVVSMKNATSRPEDPGALCRLVERIADQVANPQPLRRSGRPGRSSPTRRRRAVSRDGSRPGSRRSRGSRPSGSCCPSRSGTETPRPQTGSPARHIESVTSATAPGCRRGCRRAHPSVRGGRPRRCRTRGRRVVVGVGDQGDGGDLPPDSAEGPRYSGGRRGRRCGAGDDLAPQVGVDHVRPLGVAGQHVPGLVTAKGPLTLQGAVQLRIPDGHRSG